MKAPIVRNDITIVGAGISGMITALGLAAKNIKTCVIEKGSLSEAELEKDFRTTALSKASQEIMIDLNIWHMIKAATNPIKDIYVIDSYNARSILHFPANLVAEDAMGYMIKNIDLRKILLESVKNSPLIELITSSEYDEIKIEDFTNLIYLKDGKIIESELTIICDGKFSQARQQLFTTHIDKDYQQKAIIFNIKHEKNHLNFAIEHFMSQGPFAILPLSGGYESSIVWSLQNDVADILIKMPSSEFKKQVDNILTDFLGTYEFSSPIKSFPLSASLVNEYYNKNVVILADAAHTIHPLAGQGLNLGIQDIFSLISVIESCKTSGLPFLSSYLENYHKNRKRSNLQMFFITDVLNSIFSNRSNILSKFRRTGLSFINSNNFLKSLIIKYAMGKLRLGKS